MRGHVDQRKWLNRLETLEAIEVAREINSQFRIGSLYINECDKISWTQKYYIYFMPVFVILKQQNKLYVDSSD